MWMRLGAQRSISLQTGTSQAGSQCVLVLSEMDSDLMRRARSADFLQTASNCRSEWMPETTAVSMLSAVTASRQCQARSLSSRFRAPYAAGSTPASSIARMLASTSALAAPPAETC